MKLAAFDFNGTFLADTHACLAAANAVLRRYGSHEIGIHQYRKVLVFPAVDFYAALGCQRQELLEHTEEMGALWLSVYEAGAKHARTRRGSRALLHFLDKSRITSVVVSNHTHQGISAQVERLGLGPFETILANPDIGTTMHGRVKAARLEAYVQERGYQGNEILVVGDAPEDIEMGHRIQAHTVAVTDGSYDAARLKSAKPEYIISNLEQLIPIIQRYPKQII